MAAQVSAAPLEVARPHTARNWSIFLELSFAVPATVLLLMIIAAIFAPRLAPYDPLAQSLTDRLQPPSAAHWLGTDKLGRDVLSRLIFGTRISLGVSLSVILITSFVGTVLAIV